MSETQEPMVLVEITDHPLYRQLHAAYNANVDSVAGLRVALARCVEALQAHPSPGPRERRAIEIGLARLNWP